MKKTALTRGLPTSEQQKLIICIYQRQLLTSRLTQQGSASYSFPTSNSFPTSSGLEDEAAHVWTFTIAADDSQVVSIIGT
jgi:hypothetical protein